MNKDTLAFTAGLYLVSAELHQRKGKELDHVGWIQFTHTAQTRAELHEELEFRTRGYETRKEKFSRIDS